MCPDRDTEKESASGRKAPKNKRCMKEIGKMETLTALVLFNRKSKGFYTAANF